MQENRKRPRQKQNKNCVKTEKGQKPRYRSRKWGNHDIKG